MLDVWIIEKLREQEKVQDDRPRIYCPVPDEDDLRPIPRTETNEPLEQRGVIHINIDGTDDEE